jgi:hypothetical protein
VVYAKPPFGGPEAVLAYLSRYTHRVAISNSRLVSADAGTVAFRWKDYRIKTGDRRRVMRLATDEFIRRFLIHVLPDGFHRIRHYGLLASATRKANIAKIRALLGADGPARPAGERRNGERRDHPAHPARAMPLLRRPHAHRRDLPPRPATAIARATEGAGRMNRKTFTEAAVHVGIDGGGGLGHDLVDVGARDRGGALRPITSRAMSATRSMPYSSRRVHRAARRRGR